MKYFKQDKLNAVILLGSIFSCFIAFYNKFPLLYPDTGTYISSAFIGVVPLDRPIFYSYFIYFLSFDLTLWPIVFAQGLLISYLNYLTLGMFFEGLKRSYVFLAITLFLVMFTGFSYNVSILIPDIFSAIAVLCFLNILLNKKLNGLQNIFVHCLFLFSICTQFSSVLNLAPLFGVIVIYLLYSTWKKVDVVISFKRVVIASVVFLSCLVIIPSVHYSIDKQYKISGSNHVFMMNRMVETGILEDYLETACKTHNFKICEYKDKIGWDFIWSPKSALQLSGGWEVNRKEYKEIILDILSQKKYVYWFLVKAVENSFKMFFTFDVAVYPPLLGGSAPFGQIEWRFKHLTREYISSLQNNSKIDVRFVNTCQQILVLTSMLLLFVTALTPSVLSKLSFELKWVVVLFLIHNILNAIICANFSAIDSRYQNRLVWLYPFIAIIVVIQLYQNKFFLKKELKPETCNSIEKQ